jgi:SsrA-binding protein
MSRKKGKARPVAPPPGFKSAEEKKPARKSQAKLIAQNRQAGYRYHLEERIEAGVALLGSEVKSARDGRVNLTDGYVMFRNGEAWLEGVHISPYGKAGAWTPEPVRSRRLLLHKGQIEKWHGRVATKGYAVVPTKIYLNAAGKVKVEIALGKGKQMADKRETIKRRVIDREAQAAVKRGGRE